MTKQEWWAGLTPLEKALVREAPQFCGDVWLVFGPFTVSDETFEGVEALKPTPPSIGCYWSKENAKS